MRANGLEKKKLCGRNSSVLSDDLILAPNVCLPAAFSMIPLHHHPSVLSDIPLHETV